MKPQSIIPKKPNRSPALMTQNLQTYLFSIILYQIVGICQEKWSEQIKGGISEKDKF